MKAKLVDLVDYRKLASLTLSIKNGDMLAVRNFCNQFKITQPLDMHNNTLIHLCVLLNHQKIYEWVAKKFPKAASGCLKGKALTTPFETALFLNSKITNHKEYWIEKFLNHPDFVLNFNSVKSSLHPDIDWFYTERLIQEYRKKGLNWDKDFLMEAITRSNRQAVDWILTNSIESFSLQVLKEGLEVCQKNKFKYATENQKEMLVFLTSLVEQTQLRENLAQVSVNTNLLKPDLKQKRI